MAEKLLKVSKPKFRFGCFQELYDDDDDDDDNNNDVIIPPEYRLQCCNFIPTTRN